MVRMGRVVAWGSVGLYCCLIFFVSSQSDLPLPEGAPEIDKIAHMLEYAVLGWLVALALRQEHPRFSRSSLLFFSIVFILMFGASDEWHQAYVPGRHADRLDFWADLLGGVLGACGYVGWSEWWRRGGRTLVALSRS